MGVGNFFAGERHQLTDGGKGKKSTQFKCEKTKRKCCRLLFPDSDQHVSVNYLKYLCTPVND